MFVIFSEIHPEMFLNYFLNFKTATTNSNREWVPVIQDMEYSGSVKHVTDIAFICSRLIKSFSVRTAFLR